MASKVPVYLRVPAEGVRLPDSERWINRFTVPSSNGRDEYMIAQERVKRHWACGCMGYRTRRYCKHLRAFGLPTAERPFEIAGFQSDGTYKAKSKAKDALNTKDAFTCPRCGYCAGGSLSAATQPEAATQQTRRRRFSLDDDI